MIAAALGQHPHLHAFPELNLFVCNTIGELLSLDESEARRTGIELTHLSGLIRAVTLLHDTATLAGPGEAFQEARRWLERRTHWTTAAMFEHLLARIAPRLGLDKSPRTALARHNIERALAVSPSARFIHLVRHPVSTARSLVLTKRFSGATASSVQQASQSGVASFALHFWLHTQQRLLELTSRVPSGRLLQVRSEAVLSDPARWLSDIAAWLDVPVDVDSTAAMLHPENSPYANADLLPPGGDNDLSFLLDPRLRPIDPPCRLDIPREWGVDPWLAGEVSRLSRQFGYEAG